MTEQEARAAFVTALEAEVPTGPWLSAEDVAEDIDFDDLDAVDHDAAKARVAHSLWRMGGYVDHLGECLADEDHSIYENECQPCREWMLDVAGRVLTRMVLR